MRIALALLLVASAAHADDFPDPRTSEGCLEYRIPGIYAAARYCEDHHLRRQWQLDLGTGVVGLGLEAPVAKHVAVQMEAIGISTFYLKVAGGGTNTYGFGAGLRGTWIAGVDGRGVYVAGAVRFAHVHGERDDAPGHGLAATAGLTVGQAFRPTGRIDVRVGLGAQVVHYDIDTAKGPLNTTVPFVAFELLVGFRPQGY